MCSSWRTIAAFRPRSFMSWSMSRFMRVLSCPEENGLVGEKPRGDEEHDRGHRGTDAQRDGGVHRHDRVGQDLALEEGRVQDRNHETLDRRSPELPEAPKAQKHG